MEKPRIMALRQAQLCGYLIDRTDRLYYPGGGHPVCSVQTAQVSDRGIGSGRRFDQRKADANWGIADHLAALVIARFSNHLGTGAI
jgi:hypothetical protein